MTIQPVYDILRPEQWERHRRVTTQFMADAFNAAFTDVVEIPCLSHSQAVSLRVTLNKHRKKYRDEMKKTVDQDGVPWDEITITVVDNVVKLTHEPPPQILVGGKPIERRDTYLPFSTNARLSDEKLDDEEESRKRGAALLKALGKDPNAIGETDNNDTDLTGKPLKL